MFANLFSYLNNNPSLKLILAAKDRPIIGVNIKSTLLIPHNSNLLEIGFPYITPTEFEHHNHKLLHQLSSKLLVSDEVMDEAAIQDEKQLTQYQEEWGYLLNQTIGVYLQRFNYLFVVLYSGSKRGTLYLTTLVDRMQPDNLQDATLPLIVTLERTYTLTHKIQNRTGRLNSHLRRTNELMPIGQIQELDNYSLRDYIRRPGNTPAEKAGSKQQLMGVKRYQEYNNLENQFLVYFAVKILHLECFRYMKDGGEEHLETVNKLKQRIETFKEDPVVKAIKITGFKMSRPNYVLQQNADYRRFYQAYQDYIKKKTENTQIWSYRNKLFGEVVYIYIVAALLRLQGVSVSPTNKLEFRNTPDLGSYLTSSKINLQVLLPDTLYDFHLEKSEKLQTGDYSLRVDKHNLHSSELDIQSKNLSIWVFWYRPSESTLKEAEIYLDRVSDEGIVIYLEKSPQVKGTIDPPWLHQFPSRDEDFLEITQFLAQKIIIPLVKDI